MKALIVTAPDELRGQLRGLNIAKLIATCANLQAGRADAAIPAVAVAVALCSLARRHQHLSTEIANLDELLEPLVAGINPALLAANGVGPDVAGQLLVSSGENHDRLTSEAAFAMLCGAAPIPASSGQFRPVPARPPGTGSTAVATGRPTPRSTASYSSGCDGTHTPVTTCSDAPRKACPRRRSSAVSSATSPASSTNSSQQTIFNSRLDIYRSILAGPWLHGQDGKRGRRIEYSLGRSISEAERAAVIALPARAYSLVIDADGFSATAPH